MAARVSVLIQDEWSEKEESIVDLAQVPRALPGIPAGSGQLDLAKMYGVLTVVFGSFSILLATSSAPSGGHLSLPVLQWAFTTPVGILAAAAGALLLAVPLFFVQRRRVVGELARVVDVTELPLDRWPRQPRARIRPLSAERWLGRGFWTRIASLLAAALAVLLCAVLVSGFLAITAYSFTSPKCQADGCMQVYAPVLAATLPGIFGGVCLMLLAQYWWLRRLERRFGIWLRETGGRMHFAGLRPLYYVRRPDTAACVTALPVFLFFRRRSRLYLARTLDVTDLPLAAVPQHVHVPAWRLSGERWLGHGRITRLVSRALLVAAALFDLLLLGGCAAVLVYTWPWRDMIRCTDQYGCRPLYLTGLISMAGVYSGFESALVGFALWLRRTAARCGVRLRYRDLPVLGPFDYVRRPNVSREAAAAAVARLARHREPPLAWGIAAGMFGLGSPFILLLAGQPLSNWLPLQWIPG
jgi:hypothetical protein